MYHLTFNGGGFGPSKLRQTVTMWSEWALTIAICSLIVLVTGGSLVVQLAAMVFGPSLGN
jgi:hypothetical protein